MIGYVTKNGGRREMETYDRSVTKTEGEEKWKLMIGSVTKNGGRRELETYEICDQKQKQKRNGNL